MLSIRETILDSIIPTAISVYEEYPKKTPDIPPFSSSEKPDPALSCSRFVFNLQLIVKTRGNI